MDEPKSSCDDILADVAGPMLRRSEHLSYIILAITLTYCIAALAAVRYLDLPPMSRGTMGTMALVMAWINRRGVVDIPIFFRTLRDHRLPHLRGVVVGMMASDIIAFAISVVTGVDLLSGIRYGI